MIQPEIFDRLMSAAPVTLVVLALIPLALGLIGYLVPLQTAPAASRCRACTSSRTGSTWSAGSSIYASFLWTAPDAGTMALAPLSDTVFAPANGIDAWIVGTALATAGFVCFAINLVATLAGMRAPGLAWRRMPLFSWAAAVIAWLLLVVGPVMIAALTMLEIDRHFDGVFFDAGEGGAPLLYEHLASIFFTGAYADRPPGRGRGDLRDPAHLRAQADLQPPRRRRVVRRDRRPRPARLDAEHVRGAAPRGLDDHGDVLRALAAGPDRGPRLRLGGDDLGRDAAS